MSANKKPDTMNPTAFRKELVKIMPGFDWTVHKTSKGFTYISATGIQTSGFNRLATLQVVWRERNGVPEYEVKSSGYGKRTPWLSEATRGTLAQALRALQDHYENNAATYGSHARDLRDARQPRTKGSKPELAIYQVIKERHRQDEKWGGPKHDDGHAITHFLNFIQDRVKEAHGQGTTPAARKNLIEIAALAVAAAESMDRKAIPSAKEEPEAQPPIGDTVPVYQIGQEHPAEYVSTKPLPAVEPAMDPACFYAKACGFDPADCPVCGDRQPLPADGIYYSDELGTPQGEDEP